MSPKLALTVLALTGMVLSAVSLKNHYSGTPTEYCDLGDNFNCDLVNRSVYSRVGPVPVALIGLLGYSALLVLARIEGRKAAAVMLAAAVAGLGFSLYLTYIEAFLLGVWCILCLGSLAAIVLMAALAGWRLKADSS
jgi:uncharacterized membrane protein